MAESLTNSRNNLSKCSFNNTGFCKFRSECRKQHFQNVCEQTSKTMQKQTFLKKKICAFSHDAHEKEIDEVQGTSKIIFEEIVNLKNLVSNNKEDNENKVKSLT